MKQNVSGVDAACKKAALRWKAGEQLRRKLLGAGADPESPEVRKYLDRLATALREEKP